MQCISSPFSGATFAKWWSETFLGGAGSEECFKFIVHIEINWGNLHKNPYFCLGKLWAQTTLVLHSDITTIGWSWVEIRHILSNLPQLKHSCLTHSLFHSLMQVLTLVGIYLGLNLLFQSLISSLQLNWCSFLEVNNGFFLLSLVNFGQKASFL